jgi:hypothetical protein
VGWSWRGTAGKAGTFPLTPRPGIGADRALKASMANRHVILRDLPDPQLHIGRGRCWRKELGLGRSGNLRESVVGIGIGSTFFGGDA